MWNEQDCIFLFVGTAHVVGEKKQKVLTFFASFFKFYPGTDCSISGCPGHCNGNGLCSGAICFCSPGFTGDDCSALSCSDEKNTKTSPGEMSDSTTDSCSGHGKCTAGRCVCNAPFGGYDCSYKTCTHLDECNGNGYCHAGECICYARYGGASCATKMCPHNCGGNAGTCSDGVCICSEGWGGEYCLERLCPGGCGHGECVQDKNGPYCACSPGWGTLASYNIQHRSEAIFVCLLVMRC